MRRPRLAERLLAALVVATGLLLGCTTTIRPVTCTGGPYRCQEGARDVKFCENEALAVEGSECAGLGLAASKHFCVVTPQTCVMQTHYEVKDRDCRVLEYQAVREWRVCSPGTPTFAP